MVNEVIIIKNRNQYFTNYTIWIHPNLLEFNNKTIELVNHVQKAINNSLLDKSNLPIELIIKKGFSGSRFRHFMNNIGNIKNGKYLEIGVYSGSTFLSVLYNNNINAIAIDGWNDTLSILGDEKNPFLQNIKNLFLSDLKQYMGNNNVTVFEKNSWEVDIFSILNYSEGKINIYFFDGGHDMEDHFMSIVYYNNILDDVFIFIVDDWNINYIRDATYAGLLLLLLLLLLWLLLLLLLLFIDVHCCL